MSRDWEQDILEWVGDNQVKKLRSNNLIKFVISILPPLADSVVDGIRWKVEYQP